MIYQCFQKKKEKRIGYINAHKVYSNSVEYIMYILIYLALTSKPIRLIDYSIINS